MLRALLMLIVGKTMQSACRSKQTREVYVGPYPEDQAELDALNAYKEASGKPISCHREEFAYEEDKRDRVVRFIWEHKRLPESTYELWGDENHPRKKVEEYLQKAHEILDMKQGARFYVKEILRPAYNSAEELEPKIEELKRQEESIQKEIDDINKQIPFLQDKLRIAEEEYRHLEEELCHKTKFMRWLSLDSERENIKDIKYHIRFYTKRRDRLKERLCLTHKELMPLVFQHNHIEREIRAAEREYSKYYPPII